MIVCVCKRVSDRDIRQAVASGLSNFEEVLVKTRAASQCGTCRACAREVFDLAHCANCKHDFGEQASPTVIRIHPISADRANC